MLDFMHAGGMLMWPLLGLGVVAVVAAVRRALHNAEGAIDPGKLARALLAGSLAWCGLGLAKVASCAFDPNVDPRLFVIGFGEALSPAILGLSIYALVALASSLSPARLSARGPA